VSTIIEIRSLTKKYGSRTAVQDLNLQVEEGDIFGFVGPNGAGKTTAIRVMTTLLQPTAGDVYVGGWSVTRNPRQVRQAIGYMPDFFGVYNDMKVWEYLDFFGACYHIPPETRTTLINDLLELVDLGHRRDDWVDRLSRGMKQRLSLARTLIHDPQVLILDEPASGLDPRARVEIRELLVELARMGKTIFFSTHILSDVAEISNRIGIIEGGNLVAAGELEELQLQIMPRRLVEITLLDRLDEIQTALLDYHGVSEFKVIQGGENGGRARVAIEFSGDDEALHRLLSDLVKRDFPILHFSENSRDLEEVFLRATKGIVT
jgi:ABC-2 type transport system ATP-binding protein